MFGLILTFPLCGLVTAAYGWEATFYTIGSITLVWFVAFWMLVYDTPEKHPRIDPEERDRIVAAVKDTVDNQNPPPVPWKSILTSGPFIGVLWADLTNGIGITTLGSGISKYLNSVQGFNLKSNGFLSGLPFMCRYFGGIFTATISDYMLAKAWIERGNARKLFNSVAAFGPAACFLVIIFAPDVCNSVLVISFLCLGMFCNGSISSGHFSSHVDLAPNFAATLLGICNTTSAIMGFIVPMVMGSLLSQESIPIYDRWNIIFGIAAGIYVIGNLIYIFLVKGEPQPWNFTKTQDQNQS